MTLTSSAQLKWACRRGMLELDVLLGNFLSDVYPKLDSERQKLFEEILSYPDPVLFSWLLNQALPEDEKIKNLVMMIQDHARKRIQS